MHQLTAEQKKIHAKALETKDSDNFNSHGKSMCLNETSTSKWVVIKHRLYLLTQAILENFIYCFVTQNNLSIRDINKICFIMISVSVHVTFKSVKVMHLSCYFSY